MQPELLILCYNIIIATNTQPPKDWQLLLAVGVIVLVDIFITVPRLALRSKDGDLVPTREFSKLNESCIYIFMFHFLC